MKPGFLPLLFIFHKLILSPQAKHSFSLLCLYSAIILQEFCGRGCKTYFCLNVFIFYLSSKLGFPGGSDGKASACNVGDPGSIPGVGRSPGEGNGNPFLDSCLENPMDGGAWLVTVHGVAKGWTWVIMFGSHKLSKSLFPHLYSS